MGAMRKYIPFFLSALLMCLLVYCIYPYLQYYIDPDGTAYLTISKRYARGDYHTAINGYWSPWSCWLTALLIKTGLEAIPASVAINTIGAAGFLYISQALFLRFNLSRSLQWLMCVTLAFFLCYAVYWQSFDDLWECFFLLTTLRIMLSAHFIEKPVLWVAIGITGTLAYFAKAYSFPFFILNTVCCSYFLTKGDKKLWARISITAVAVMTLCSLPWIWALHQKYGIWTTSTAGTLNTSWYLVGHPHWKAGIDLLLPPPYPDSPNYWEDPWLVNGDTPHFWNSWHLLGLQLLRVGLNIWKFIVSSFQLSVFFIVIVGYTKWRLFWKKDMADSREKVLMLSFLLFTVGYILVNFESRYLWYMVPLSMVLGGSIIQEKLGSSNRFVKFLIFGLFAASYLAIPAKSLYEMKSDSYNNANIAYGMPYGDPFGILKGSSFTSNVLPGRQTRAILAAAYLKGAQYYSIPSADTNAVRLLKEINRYRVKNYVNWCDPRSHRFFMLRDSTGMPYPYIDADKGGCLTVFTINP